MSKSPKPIVGKWQFIYNSSAPVYMMTDPFTREVTIGFVKLKELPVEGTSWDKHYYKGFILRWFYWWPIRRSGRWGR